MLSHCCRLCATWNQHYGVQTNATALMFGVRTPQNRLSVPPITSSWQGKLRLFPMRQSVWRKLQQRTRPHGKASRCTLAMCKLRAQKTVQASSRQVGETSRHQETLDAAESPAPISTKTSHHPTRSSTPSNRPHLRCQHRRQSTIYTHGCTQICPCTIYLSTTSVSLRR